LKAPELRGLPQSTLGLSVENQWKPIRRIYVHEVYLPITGIHNLTLRGIAECQQKLTKLKTDSYVLNDVLLLNIVLTWFLASGHPYFFNQLSQGLDMISMAGEWLAATANTNMFTYEIAPVFIMMEHEVSI
jgi:hypothetical protein